MALSEQVSLSIEEALRQLTKLDRALAKSLRANVQVDIIPALEDIKILRKTAETALTKKYALDLNTTEATRKLAALETKIKAFRQLAEKAISVNFSATQINNTARAIDKATEATRTFGRQQNVAAKEARAFTAALEKQVVEAGLLSKELRDVAASAEAIAATSRSRRVQFGPGRAELKQILADQKEFEKNIGLGPINNERVKAIEAQTAVATAAEREIQAAIAETAAAQKKADAEAVASAERAAKERIAAEKKVATAAERERVKAEKAASRGRDVNGQLLGPINSGRVLAIQEEERIAKEAAKAEQLAIKETQKAEQLAAKEKAAALRKAQSETRALSIETGSLNRQLIDTGRSLSLLFTLPTVAAAAFAAFNEFKFQETIQRTKVLTDAFTKFDESGRRVNLTSQETSVRIGALRDVFSSIATQTGTTPNDVAKGFYFVASAGGEAATRLSILRVAAQGAAIGLGSVEVVADTLTSVLNAYGEANITAASAGDILVRAVNDAKVEASDFAPQLGRLLPVAAQLGIGFGQVAESLALLTQNGNNASVASTQLRGIFQTLVKPTSEKAAEILQKVGLSTAQLREQVSRKSPTALIDTLVRLRKVLPLEEFSQLFRRIDALNGALSLTNNPDAAKGFLAIAQAAKNTSGNLDEFNRFVTQNKALQIKQAFSQLLVQLQPLGQKVLPLVAKGLGGIVAIIDKISDLLKIPILGKFVLGLGAAAAAAGPLIFSLGKIRTAFQALGKVSDVLGVEGGLKRFLKGETVAAITAGAGEAEGKVGKLGLAFKALPGLIGVGAAAALAFFSGSAIASDNLKTKILGVVGTIGSMALAFYAARAALAAFGVTSSVALGGIGVVAALIVGGIAAFSAYKTATEKSQKAVEEFENSLKGFTANEAIQNFAASLTKSLGDITADDRVTRIEIPELQKALRGLGLSYEEVGSRIANIVLANPTDLVAQRNGLRSLSKELSKSIGGARGDDLAGKLSEINKEITKFQNESEGGALLALGDGLVTGEELSGLIDTIGEVAHVSDAAKESLTTLANKGLLTFSNGILAIPTGKLAEAKAAIGDSFGKDSLNLLDIFAESFRRARQTALDTTGEFTLASNAAGSFIETLGADGESTTTAFVANVDDVTASVSGLTSALNDAVAAVFGFRDATFTSEAIDTLKQNDTKRGADITKRKDANSPDFINFTVDLTSPEGGDARQFIREQVNQIDSVIAPLLSGPDANIDLGLGIRDVDIATLAGQLGISVDALNAFLAQDQGGLTTVQLRAGLEKLGYPQVLSDLNKLKTLVEASPLDATVKAKIETDTTGDLFGSELINQGLRDGKVLVDFIVNAIETGTPIADLQTIFASADVNTTKQVIINAINQGVDLETISKAISAIPPEIRTQLVIDPPTFSGSGGDLQDLDKQLFLFNKNQETQYKINTIIEGADKFEELDTAAKTPVDYEITTDTKREEFDALVMEIAKGGNYDVLIQLDPAAASALRQQIIGTLANLGITPAGGRTSSLIRPPLGGKVRANAAGGVFGGGGFRRFRDGGTAVPGWGLAREPMIGRVASNRTGILWGEPQTHGEAYIPYNPARRVRAMALVSRVAKDFGMTVTSGHNGAQAERNGATMQGEQVMARNSQREVGRLAGEVARLSAVIEAREVQPIIGEYHAESATTEPRATARYLATDILKAIR